MGDTETYSLQASRPMRVQADGSRIGNTKEWAALSGLVPTAGQECKDIEAGTVKIGDGVKNYGALTALAGGGDLSVTYAPLSARRASQEAKIVQGARPRVRDARLGDASDGDGLFAATATITSDKNYRDVRVGTGVTVTVSRGVVVRVSGETLNNGTIKAESNNGSNASGATGGTGGGAPALGAGLTAAIGASGSNAGATGGTGVGAAGTASAAKTTHGGTGGAGGNGGSASGGATAGGTGGAAGTKTTALSALRTVEAAQAAWLTATLATGVGAGSGAAGGGDGTNAGGGGGGGGSAGGFLLWVTSALSGAGVFAAPGGNGGNGANGVAGNAGGGGAGGGGGGGIVVVAAHDTRLWTGTLTAPAGSQGTPGNGSGMGTAGTAGTAGGAGTTVLLGLNAARTVDVLDTVPVVAVSAENGAAPAATVYTLSAMPVRFRGGPMAQRVIGPNTYMLNDLHTPNSGFPGKNNGGAPYVVDFWSDASTLGLKIFAGNGKYRVKVDGDWIGDYAVSTYTGTGGFYWLQVSHSTRRQMRRYEIHMSSVPLAAVCVGATDTIYPATEPLDIPRAFLGDSFTEGASGGLNAATWEMGGWAWRLAEKLGWDNVIVDAQGGTGYLNDSGEANGKKTFPQRVVDDFTPLPATQRPRHWVLAGGFNDGNGFGLGAAVTTTLDNIQTVSPGSVVDVVHFVTTGSPSGATTSGAATIKAAALAHSSVRSVTTEHDGVVALGPAAKVTSISAWVTGAWLTGTGNVGTPVGDGNCDFFVSGDAIHPAYPEGHEYLATRVMGSIQMALPRA